MRVEVKLLRDGVKVPKYEHQNDSGFDLSAAQTTVIAGGATDIVPTGLAMAISPGFELQVRPRSGTSLRSALRVANAPGTVDASYRGEIGIIMHNTGSLPITIEAGTRIAQGVICPVVFAEFEVVPTLSGTSRGENGYGSTGDK